MTNRSWQRERCRGLSNRHSRAYTQQLQARALLVVDSGACTQQQRVAVTVVVAVRALES